MSPIATPNRRSAARRVACFGIVVVVGLTLLEVVLRVAPGVVDGKLANAVHSAYHANPGGIYFHDRQTRIDFMRPDTVARCYWNGYFWQHRADAEGFRNPPGTASDGLLLLGDSMIYGHGVDEDDTFTHHLRSEHGRPAYNMGRPGDTLYQEYVRARLALDRLHPEQLVLFVFLNDFEDMAAYRTPEQIRDAPELEQLDYEALAARVRQPVRDDLDRQVRRLRVWRLLKGLRKSRPAPVAAKAEHDVLHPFIAAILDDERFFPVADYYRRVLGDLATRAHAQDVEFSVVLLDIGDRVNHFAVPHMIPAQDRLFAMLSEIGTENDFLVRSTRDLYLGCSDCFLPNDGHLTPEGHRRLAAFVDRELPRPAAPRTAQLDR